MYTPEFRKTLESVYVKLDQMSKKDLVEFYIQNSIDIIGKPSAEQLRKRIENMYGQIIIESAARHAAYIHGYKSILLQ